MSTAVRLKTNEELLRELDALPPGQAGEVIDGSLYVMGRPGPPHQLTSGEIWGNLRYRGPGGRNGAWVIYQEVSVRFPTNEEVVPDLSGWRRERLSDGQLAENPMRVRPDWVCEILSESTRHKDLGPKRELYARQGVEHLWLIDPGARVLEAFELSHGRWQLLGTWTGSASVTGVAPFFDFTVNLVDWWLDEA